MKMAFLALSLFVGAAFGSSASALPAQAGEVVSAVLAHADFAAVLQANPGFRSVSVKVVWGPELTSEAEALCGEYSRSRSIVQVDLEFEMMTMPSYTTRSFYFSTPGQDVDLKLCK